MNEKDLKDCDSFAIVVDRSGIPAALDYVAAMAESLDEPNGWRAALNIFERLPGPSNGYLFAVNGRGDALTECHMYLAANNEELASMIAVGIQKHLKDAVATIWTAHGGELTHARLAKLLNHPLKNWS
jgi:hypothetical protein